MNRSYGLSSGLVSINFDRSQCQDRPTQVYQIARDVRTMAQALLS